LETTIRITATIGALTALVVAAVGLVVRYVPVTNHAVLIVAVASPYLLLGGPVGGLLSLLARRWALAGLAAVLTAALVAVQGPLFIAERAGNDGVALRVMSANLYFGESDAASLVRTATARADVLAVQELTHEEVERLSAAGLDEVFPHRALDASDLASGVGLWSRYPITTSARIDGYELAMVSARIRVEGVATDPSILVAHMSGPWPQPIDDWVRDMDRMRETMRQVSSSAGAGCVLVGGDFNATYDMLPFRRLLSDGYRDATEQSGAGLKLTYQANTKTPPYMGIDHVLTNRCTATSAATVELPGSDHEGLVAAVHVPRSTS
jgi:endonuclease/exonuclease/phosphatase (EEP) superfamily protein YafD